MRQGTANSGGFSEDHGHERQGRMTETRPHKHFTRRFTYIGKSRYDLILVYFHMTNMTKITVLGSTVGLHTNPVAGLPGPRGRAYRECRG